MQNNGSVRFHNESVIICKTMALFALALTLTKLRTKPDLSLAIVGSPPNH